MIRCGSRTTTAGAITIHDVPARTRAELAALAARDGLSAESFVRQRLIELAAPGAPTAQEPGRGPGDRSGR